MSVSRTKARAGSFAAALFARQDQIGLRVFAAIFDQLPQHPDGIFGAQWCAGRLVVAQHLGKWEISAHEIENRFRRKTHAPHTPRPELAYDQIGFPERLHAPIDNGWLDPLAVDFYRQRHGLGV